jgi:zinc transporter, ZIP family
MRDAFFWGAVAGSSLVFGCLFALRFRISKRALGLIMGFGAGVLISAVAYELVQEAVETSVGGEGVALGFALGSATFFAGSVLIDRVPAGQGASAPSGSAMPIRARDGP